MGVRIVCNTIADTSKRKEIASAVLAGIGQPLKGQDWWVWILQPSPTRYDYLIAFEGPQALLWQQNFRDQSPDVIREQIAKEVADDSGSSDVQPRPTESESL